MGGVTRILEVDPSNEMWLQVESDVFGPTIGQQSEGENQCNVTDEIVNITVDISGKLFLRNFICKFDNTESK